MSAVPQLNAPARPTHMIRILLGICSLLRAATRVDAADFLDSNPRMSLNRVVHCLVRKFLNLHCVDFIVLMESFVHRLIKSHSAHSLAVVSL
jgi:hypothetical protein